MHERGEKDAKKLYTNWFHACGNWLIECFASLLDYYIIHGCGNVVLVSFTSWPDYFNILAYMHGREF